MSNETFALLAPFVIFLAVAGTATLVYWDIVRRHPVKSKKTRRVVGSHISTETSATDELNQRIAIRLQENAVSTERIVREANQLASSVERFTKAVTGAK